jgi:glycosyltransferase involved in cell wall biosynthesis
MSRGAKISFVIPVYNEEENLPRLHDEIVTAMQPTGRDFEVLYVDDGSRDKSLEVLRELSRKDPRARYLAFAENRGQSAAFKAGFQEARGGVIVTMDSDLQNDPADAPRLIEALEAGGAELVAGRRARRKDSFHKRAGSRVGNTVRNWVTRDRVSDTGCSLKAMDAELARRLPMFTGMHRFFPALVQLEGGRVLEVDVNHRPRLHGTSNYSNWKRALVGLHDLVAVHWMRLRYIRYTVKERSGDGK